MGVIICIWLVLAFDCFPFFRKIVSFVFAALVVIVSLMFIGYSSDGFDFSLPWGGWVFIVVCLLLAIFIIYDKISTAEMIRKYEEEQERKREARRKRFGDI